MTGPGIIDIAVNDNKENFKKKKSLVKSLLSAALQYDLSSQKIISSSV